MATTMPPGLSHFNTLVESKRLKILKDIKIQDERSPDLTIVCHKSLRESPARLPRTPNAPFTDNAMTPTARLDAIAARERLAAAAFAARILPADTRVSVYLFQPMPAPALR